MRQSPFITLTLLALTACGESDATSRNAIPAPREQAAREASLAALRHRLRPNGGIEQRGVQVFAQALPNQAAVCGRARLPGSAQAPYLPYVAVLEFSGEAVQVVSFQLGASGAEASRVFLEMVDRCFEGGGPTSARPMARNLPPLPDYPDNTPNEATPAEPAGAPPMLRVAASGSVTTSSRMGANIRSSARGGEVVRTVPPSTVLEVISEAPGGWYQVGERGAPLGWIHSSVLEAR